MCGEAASSRYHFGTAHEHHGEGVIPLHCTEIGHNTLPWDALMKVVFVAAALVACFASSVAASGRRGNSVVQKETSASPIWLKIMKQRFGDLSHCPTDPPSSVTKCSEERPPCFYDTQGCAPGVYPEVRCDCVNSMWDCDMFECPDDDVHRLGKNRTDHVG